MKRFCTIFFGFLTLLAGISTAAEPLVNAPIPYPPAFYAPLTASGFVGNLFLYRPSVSILPDTFQATGLPPGLTLDTVTGTITGKPILDGTYHVTLSATDMDGLTGTANLVFTFGYPTAIISSLQVTALVNRPFTYQISASHQPTEISVQGLPAGFSFDPKTGIIRGTPTAAGTVGCRVTAQNSFGTDIKELVFRFVSDTAIATLYSFSSQVGGSPSGLILGSDGNFYGTAIDVSSQRTGTVFKVTPAGEIVILHNFSADEGVPYTGVIQAGNGAFYGTTGNNFGPGTIFKITADGVLTRLRTLAGGPSPPTALIQAGDGNLYGSAEGSTFRIGPDDTVTTVAAVAASYALVQSPDGSLYGTTTHAGQGGSIFRLALDGTVTTLHSFENFVDSPNSALVQAGDGAFYGTTGGPISSHPAGSIYRITVDGEFTTVHVLQDEGYSPFGLILSKDGNIYGTTHYGGTDPATSGGTIFKVAPDGTFTTVHSFSDSDGGMPGSPLIPAPDGNFYGTTSRGGDGGRGTIFETRFNSPPVDLSLPVATLNATAPKVVPGYGAAAEFTVTLSAPSAADVVVNYTIGGSAANGTDDVRLSGTRKIKAGKTSKKIKVVPQGDLGGARNKTVVLTLAAGDGYTVGTTGKVKVKILAP